MSIEKNADRTLTQVYCSPDIGCDIIKVLDQSLALCGCVRVDDVSVGYGIFDDNDAALEMGIKNSIILSEDSRNSTGYSASLPLRAGEIIDLLTRLKHGLARSYPEKIDVHPYMFYVQSMYLTHQQTGDMVKLTEKERDLLFYLTQHAGQYISRETLLGEIWGYGDGVETHTVETHFYRLRQKIEQDSTHPALLLTHEDGYILKI